MGRRKGADQGIPSERDTLRRVKIDAQIAAVRASQSARARPVAQLLANGNDVSISGPHADWRAIDAVRVRGQFSRASGTSRSDEAAR